MSSSLRLVSDFFPFSRRRLRYLVLSALDFGEFKRFNDAIYQKLREMSLFVLYVYEQDFESPWLLGYLTIIP